MLTHCRAPLPPDSHLFDKYHGKKASDYDIPHAQVLVTIEFTHVAGYLSWKHGRSIIMVVQTLYNPSDSSCLNLKQPTVASAIRTVLLWWISSYIMSEYICAFHYLFVWSVALLMLPDLVYKCISLSFMEVQAQLSNLILSIILLKIRLLSYNLTM